MPAVATLVHQTSIGTGTGTLTLAAVNGKQTFAAAFGTGVTTNVFDYFISNQGAAEWERGTGHLADSITLVRDTVLESSNAGAAVNFSAGAKDVVNDIPPAKQVRLGENTSTEAQAEAGTDGTASVMTPQAVSQAIQANALSFKNIAGRNGGFEIWQRGSPVSVAASTVGYTVDGWYLATGTNQAATVTQQPGLTNGSQFCAQVQRNSGQTGTTVMRFAMPLDIDELKKAAGNAIQLSFTAAAGANWSPTGGTLSYTVYFGTGAVAKRNATAYTGETTPINGSVNLSPGGAAQQVFAAISTAVGANVTCAEIQFSWTPAGTAGVNDWLEIDDVDLRAVPAGLAAAKPTFERTDYIWDYLRCQRHLPSWSSAGHLAFVCIGQAFNTTQVCANFPFTIPARVPVTGLIVSTAVGNFIVTTAALGNLTCTGLVFNQGGIDSVDMVATAGTASLVAGNASFLYALAGNSLLFTGAEI